MSWFDDMSDRELLDLIPFFEQLARTDDIFSFILNANLPISLTNSITPSPSPTNQQSSTNDVNAVMP